MGSGAREIYLEACWLMGLNDRIKVGDVSNGASSTVPAQRTECWLAQLFNSLSRLLQSTDPRQVPHEEELTAWCERAEGLRLQLAEKYEVPGEISSIAAMFDFTEQASVRHSNEWLNFSVWADQLEQSLLHSVSEFYNKEAMSSFSFRFAPNLQWHTEFAVCLEELDSALLVVHACLSTPFSNCLQPSSETDFVMKDIFVGFPNEQAKGMWMVYIKNKLGLSEVNDSDSLELFESIFS